MMVAAGSLGVVDVGDYLVRLHERHEREQRTAAIFEEGVTELWPCLNVFPGLVAIPPTVRAYRGMFDRSNTKENRVPWPTDEKGQPLITLARSPIFVGATLALFGKNQSSGSYTREDVSAVTRIAREFKTGGLMRFWLPDGSPAYLDAVEAAGHIQTAYRPTEGVVATDPSGRYIVGQTITSDILRQDTDGIIVPYLEQDWVGARPLTPAQQQQIVQVEQNPRLSWAQKQELITEIGYVGSGAYQVDKHIIPLGCSSTVANDVQLGEIFEGFLADAQYEPVTLSRVLGDGA